jgi:hypothetical protein
MFIPIYWNLASTCHKLRKLELENSHRFSWEETKLSSPPSQELWMRSAPCVPGLTQKQRFIVHEKNMSTANSRVREPV